MAQTLEDLQLVNQQLRERIEELEKAKKEKDVADYKKAHDQWVGNNRGRGIK
jgi:regulator of replication initiation timing